MNLALLLAVLAVPNIVVITADDLSVSALADALVNGWMPNLKASIIDQGVTFANSFVGDSVCAPSRATFLTGQHSHNHGVRTNAPPLGGVTLLDDSSTLPVWLQATGYRTGLVGKYLNGYGTDTSPTYIPTGWNDWQALTVENAMYDYAINDNGTLVAYGSNAADYQTDVLALRAADFINESSGAQPFFLWVTPQAPHQGGGFVCSLNVGAISPLPPAPRHAGVTDNLPLPNQPSFNEANISDKPGWVQAFSLLTNQQKNCLRTGHRNRVGSMLAFDDLVGVVVAALQANGELTDTLIVVTSDNGYLLGEHRVNSKQQAYEEAIRVPLYARAPGSTTAHVAQQLVANMDLPATLLELAGGTAGLVQDGRSLVPILQDSTYGPWRTAFLIEHVRLGGGVLVPPNYQAIRTQQHKLVEYGAGERELYNLAADMSEMVSQHTNPAYEQVKGTLRQALNQLRTCAGATCWQ